MVELDVLFRGANLLAAIIMILGGIAQFFPISLSGKDILGNRSKSLAKVLLLEYMWSCSEQRSEC